MKSISIVSPAVRRLCEIVALAGASLICGCGDENWEPLITPDLALWHTHPFWAVHDDILEPNPEPEFEKTWILTRERYSNFALRLQFRLHKDSNGGVLVRFPSTGVTTLAAMAQVGFEVQLIDNESLVDIDPSLGLGAVTGLAGPDPPLVVEREAWHRLRVDCRGDSVLVWVDDDLVLQADLSGRSETLIRTGGLREVEGHLGLIDDGESVEYRDIEVLRLPHEDAYVDLGQ